MSTLRVSVTDIDALRFYMNPPVPEMEIDLDELLRRLRREEPPTPEMLAGTAFHNAMERAVEGEVPGLRWGDYTFSFETDASLDLPDIREMKASKTFNVDGDIVTLVGKVDCIHGRRIEDHKLTKSFDAEKYLDSFQWKGYLDIFDADNFRWNVFEGRPTIEGGTDYLIRNVHKLEMHRYPGITEDVERVVRNFVVFARDHLPERFQRAAA